MFNIRINTYLRWSWGFFRVWLRAYGVAKTNKPFCTAVQLTYANCGCRSPPTDNIHLSRAWYPVIRFLNDSREIESHARTARFLKILGSRGHPSSPSLIAFTIQLHTISIKFRSGLFAGHAGSRSSSRVCFVLVTFIIARLCLYQSDNLRFFTIVGHVSYKFHPMLDVAVSP